MTTQLSTRCLLLACGNTLREDDGVGPWLAAWAEERFDGEPALRVLARQQWTPELAQDVAEAGAVIFIDCATNFRAGEVKIGPAEPEAPRGAGLATHHVEAGELLALSEELYSARPYTSLLLTVGAGSLELREGFSGAVQAALPEACELLEKTVRQLIAAAHSRPA
ncbi:MAG: hydrogenase maturation protease [Terracidiphilus sp.]